MLQAVRTVVQGSWGKYKSGAWEPERGQYRWTVVRVGKEQREESRAWGGQGVPG